jgi:hypothetical protein
MYHRPCVVGQSIENLRSALIQGKELEKKLGEAVLVEKARNEVRIFWSRRPSSVANSHSVLLWLVPHSISVSSYSTRRMPFRLHSSVLCPSRPGAA